MYAKLPMYQRVGQKALKKNLENITKICLFLGEPHHKYRTIHIAGTNGKGSSAHWIAAILQSAGYKTGLYTSPHLKSFTERIKVNGKEIPQQAVVDFITELQPVIAIIQPSFFEITVAMAFQYFAYEQVDIAVVEVGLGGRLDSTNIISPELCLITNIAYDHAQILGDTLPKIAREKAGIIKKQVPVVISETHQATREVFLQKAKQKHAPIYFADTLIEMQNLSAKQFRFIKKDGFIIDAVMPGLTGTHQLKNIKGVLQSVEILRMNSDFNIDTSHIKQGIEAVVSLTNIKGRWQILEKYPWQICDIAHNPQALVEVRNRLQELTFGKLYIVFGMVADKDIEGILSVLPCHAYYFFCTPKIPRALNAAILHSKATKQYHLKGEVKDDVNLAIRQARKIALADDLIFIGGSAFVVAEIDNL